MNFVEKVKSTLYKEFRKSHDPVSPNSEVLMPLLSFLQTRGFTLLQIAAAPSHNRSYRRRRRSCRCETFGGRHEGVENKSQSCPVPYQILSEKAAEFMQINLRTEDWMEAPPATSRFQPIDAGGLKSWLHNVLQTFAKCIFANYVVHLH